MTTNTTPAPIAYEVTNTRDVTRFINGKADKVVNRRDLTAATAQALAVALNDAVQRGTAHGLCDWRREMVAIRMGEYTGHTVYAITGEDITMTVNGETTVVFDGAKVRPSYLIGDFYNELELAFRMGGLATRVVG